jgi:hypothetical protein
MAVHSGPKVTTTGLVFEYDMSNTAKSWMGAPATNLMTPTATNAYLSLTTANATYGPLSLLTTPTPFGTQAHQMTFTVLGDTNYYGINTCRFISNTVAVPKDGTTYYKYSVWLYTDSWGVYTSSVYLYVTGSNGMTGASDSGQRALDSLGREWRRYTMTGFVLTGGGIAYQYHTFYKSNPITSDINVLACAPDFYGEAVGGYIAPYVNGTRSNTQALLDLTRNNTITTNSLTYASDGTFSFNGVADYMDFPISGFSQQFTIIAWIKSTVAGREQHIADFSGSQFYKSAANMLHTASWSTAGGATGIALNTWYQVAQIRDSSKVDLYLNGNFDGTGTLGGNPGSNFTVGDLYGHAGGYRFGGSIARVEVYNRALTATEIQNNFEAIRSRYGI